MKTQRLTLALATILLTCLPLQIALADSDDLLATDDFSFDSSELESAQAGWLDSLKTTLDHSHENVPGDIRRERSSVRLEYESSIAQGWYFRLDTRYRYFWHQDELAEQRGERYGQNKWQRAWIQYSNAACAHKLGRQTLIWGEVDGTFVTDVVTPFDYTEQLLTDYSNVRLAQDMLVSECFFDNSQLQVFYTPQAKTTIFQHQSTLIQPTPELSPIALTADANEEWGLRYQWRGEGFDISAMYARLDGNTPVLILDNNQPAAELAHFDLYGLATSVAFGRLLIKAEAAYKTEQLLQLTDQVADRFDAAVGFEYTTSSNHFFNAGVWATHFKENDAASSPEDIQVLTIGWQKTYLNDDLAMSLLGNWASSPRFGSVTVLADYQWTDFWSLALALGIADLSEEAEGISVAPKEKSATVIVRYEF